jgi:hypothetical protein
MKIEQVEIYSDTSNAAIMRHPGRKFPGSLIQGDSLHILVGEARELLAAVAKSGDEDLTGLAQDHLEKLEGRLKHYEKVLEEHGIQLPYNKRT